MPPTIDYFYSLLSSFTYLGTPRLVRIAEASGAVIRHRPMDIQAVFQAVGTVPPARQPAVRQAYRQAELERWSRRLGLPITLRPKHWPVPARLASCAVLAAMAAGADPAVLSFAFLRAVWVEDRDISDEGVVEAILNERGLAGAGVLAAAKAPETQAIYDGNTTEAIERGVFGSPSYVVDGVLYWGQDRLDFVEAALKESAADSVSPQEA